MLKILYLFHEVHGRNFVVDCALGIGIPMLIYSFHLRNGAAVEGPPPRAVGDICRWLPHEGAAGARITFADRW